MKKNMTVLERAMLIANIYQNIRGNGIVEVKGFLDEIVVDRDYLLFYDKWLTEELSTITLLEQEYFQVDEDDEYHDVIIQQQFVANMMEIDSYDVNEDPEETLDNLRVGAIVAYKYQLKYCLLMFTEMLSNYTLWRHGVH